jgi:predicted regulator of Ras-like GTPase activity (Roadblock/LC7/MglB family)
MSLSDRFAVPRAVFFSKEQMKEIEACLDELTRDTAVSTIIVTDITGQLIEFRGQMDKREAEALAALIAGSHAASAEFVKLLGKEAPFVNLTHEADDYSIYSVNVAESVILSVAFGRGVKIGIVRVFVEEARCKLSQVIHEVSVTSADANAKKMKLIDKDLSDFNDLLEREFGKIIDHKK